MCHNVPLLILLMVHTVLLVMVTVMNAVIVRLTVLVVLLECTSTLRAMLVCRTVRMGTTEMTKPRLANLAYLPVPFATMLIFARVVLLVFCTPSNVLVVVRTRLSWMLHWTHACSVRIVVWPAAIHHHSVCPVRMDTISWTIIASQPVLLFIMAINIVMHARIVFLLALIVQVLLTAYLVLVAIFSIIISVLQPVVPLTTLTTVPINVCPVIWPFAWPAILLPMTVSPVILGTTSTTCHVLPPVLVTTMLTLPQGHARVVLFLAVNVLTIPSVRHAWPHTTCTLTDVFRIVLLDTTLTIIQNAKVVQAIASYVVQVRFVFNVLLIIIFWIVDVLCHAQLAILVVHRQ